MLVHFVEIINAGIENNVLTDIIRGSFRISENHKRRLQMLSSILNRMNSDCFSSDDILIKNQLKIIDALSNNIMNECDLQNEIKSNPAQSIALNYTCLNDGRNSHNLVSLSDSSSPHLAQGV